MKVKDEVRIKTERNTVGMENENEEEGEGQVER